MRVAAALGFCMAVLAGCANPWNTMNIPAGASRQDVIARAGQPIRVLPQANGGERMQYTLQPTGRYAFMVDLDATGHVVRVRQVMTPAEFNRIVPDQWTRADVEADFGPPALVDHVTSFQGDIYTYRWYEPGQGPMFWYVYFDPQGVVRRAHPGIEHINGPGDRR
ncbi:MAG: hypothetical protein ACHP7E_04225 [Burkholderiales bacterium]